LGDLFVGHLNLLPGRRFDPGRYDALLVVHEVIHSSFSSGFPVRVVEEPLDDGMIQQFVLEDFRVGLHGLSWHISVSNGNSVMREKQLNNINANLVACTGMPENFINLSCANCGGKLDVYDDMERFACGYCGTEMIVQRRGGTVSLKAVTDAIERVQVGTDKTAAELALVRLRQELAALEAKAANLTYEPPPAGKGCVLFPAIVVVGIVVLLAMTSKPGVGGPLIVLLIVAVVVLVGGIAAATNNAKHEAWKTAKAALNAETAKVKQEIARQLEIVSGSGSGAAK
jgi:predicted RNA-binding Zn-ribbon protein involved in translation (DUF1610 family)